MTRKDYVRLAEALRISESVEEAASNIADVLKRDNPRFDRARFYAACGLEPRERKS